MKTTKRKTKAAAKRRPTNLREARKTTPKIAAPEAAWDTPSRGGHFWTINVPPGPPTVLGKGLYRLTMVLQNHGPGSIWVNTGYVDDNVRLGPDQTRVIAIRDQIQIVTTDGNFALCDFEIKHAMK